VRKGFAKAMMLTGLGLFGKMTTPAEASFATVVVTGESIKTSILTSAISAITTKLGMTIMAIALTAGMGTFYTLYSVKNNEQLNGLNLPERNSVRSFHYVEQAWNNTAETNPNLSRGRSLSKGAYEQWFYFPEGLDGAMFMMMQRWDPMMESKLCSWMQNSKGNYYFHSGNETIHINNYNLPLRDLRVRRLPTDSVEFTRFLDSIEGKTKGISYERDKKTGFLIGSLDNRFYNAGNFRNSISYNHLDEEDFTSFRYSWPVDACVVDERDAMHKRGWTFYKIRGLTGNCPIYGRGRIPFVYEKYNEYCPWVELAIGDNCTIIDNNKQCYASDAGGKVTTIYVPGTFLKAFSRPWMGMHTIDLIRREAAKEKIRFKTRQKLLSENIAVVTLHFDNYGYTTVVGYEINLEKDLIKQISFNATDTAGEMRQGYIYFEYTEGVEENPDYFSPPLFHETSTSTNHYNNSSLSWLAELAQGKLVK
jgi:hypothetical protein